MAEIYEHHYYTYLTALLALLASHVMLTEGKSKPDDKECDPIRNEYKQFLTLNLQLVVESTLNIYFWLCNVTCCVEWPHSKIWRKFCCILFDNA